MSAGIESALITANRSMDVLLPSEISAGRVLLDQTPGSLFFTATGLYLFSVPFDGVSLAGGRSLPFFASIVVVCAAAGELLLGSSLRAVRMRGAAGPAFVLVVIGALSSLWSVAPSETFSRVATQLFLYLVAAVAAVAVGFRRQLLWAFVLGCTALVPYVLTAPQEQFTGRRTFEGNENDVACALATGVAIAMFLAYRGSKRARALAVACAAMAMVGVVATGSRALLIGAVLVVPTGVLWSFSRRPARSIGVLVGGALILMLGQSLLPAALVPSRLTGILGALQSGDLSGRTQLWHLAVDHGISFGGIGWGTSTSFYQHLTGQATVTHNFFVGVLLELGVVGLLAWAWLWASALRATSGTELRLLNVLLFPVVAASLMTLTLDARRIFWFFIACAWAGGVSITRATSWQHLSSALVAQTAIGERQPQSERTGVARNSG